MKELGTVKRNLKETRNNDRIERWKGAQATLSLSQSFAEAMWIWARSQVSQRGKRRVILEQVQALNTKASVSPGTMQSPRMQRKERHSSCPQGVHHLVGRNTIQCSRYSWKCFPWVKHTEQRPGEQACGTSCGQERIRLTIKRQVKRSLTEEGREYGQREQPSKGSWQSQGICGWSVGSLRWCDGRWGREVDWWSEYWRPCQDIYVSLGKQPGATGEV